MIWIAPEILKNGLIIFNLAVFMWECYLNLRQFRMVYKADVPENFRRHFDQTVLYYSRQYTLYKLILWFLKELERIVIIIWILYVEKLNYFWESLMIYSTSEIMMHIIAFYVFVSVPPLLNLPFKIFEVFYLEPKFGLAKHNFLFFIGQSVKSIVIGNIYKLVLFVLISSAMAFTVTFAIEYYYTTELCILIVSMICIEDLIFPSLIAQFFHKYSPLPEGDLKIYIENLCLQFEFPLKKIMVKHNSENVDKVAYIEGLSSNKIVIAKSILKYENEIVLAIISHEIANSKLKCYRKKYNVTLIYYILSMVFYFNFINYYPLYKALGFTWWKPAPVIGSFAIFHFIQTPSSRFYKLFLYHISRQVEMEADEYVIQNTEYNFKKSILKVWEYSLLFPVMDKYYCKWFYDHIPVVERLTYIDSKCRKRY